MIIANRFYRNKSSESKRTPEEQIRLFIEISQELRESRLFSEGLKTSIEINWNSDSDSLQSKLKNHDTDDLRSFLTIFRKFTANTSDLQVNKIYKLCPHYLSDIELKKLIADDFEVWRNIQNKSEWDEKRISLKFKLDGKEYLPKEFAEKWMNGFVFHDSLEAKSFFKDLSPPLLDNIKYSINGYINSSTTHILNFAEGINAALKQGLFTFQ